MGQRSKSSETPAHPSWISRFCGDQIGGGWREVQCEAKRQTFESQWEKHEGMDRLMDGRMDEGTDLLVIKECGRVNGELGLTRQHHRQWQTDSQRQTTVASTMKEINTEGIFHSQWQPRSRSWLRGLNHLHTDNVVLWNLIQPYAPVPNAVFLCIKMKQASSKSWQIKTYFTGELEKNWSWFNKLSTGQNNSGPTCWFPVVNTHELPLRTDYIPGCNSTSDKCFMLTWRRRCWIWKRFVWMTDQKRAS